MSVHEQNAENNAQSNQQSQRHEQRSTGEREFSRPRQDERPAVTGNVLDVNRLLGGGMSRKTSGEVLVSAIAAMKFWFSPERQVAATGAVDLTKIQVIGLEASEYNVEVSSVILAYPVEVEGKNCVLHHFLALDGSLSDENATRVYNTHGREYVLPVLTSDYMTESYLTLVDEVVKKHFDGSRRSVTPFRAGWRTVNRKVNFAEHDSKEVRDVAFYAQAAMTAMYNEIFHSDLFFSLDWLTKNTTLEIGVDMSGRVGHSSDMQPRRRDIAVTVAGKMVNGDQTANITLASLGADLRLFYTPPQEEDRWSRNQRRDLPYFTPVCVINSIDTGTNSITPEQLLLGLAGSSVISANQAWAQTLLPNDVARGEIDYKNTGLLSILGPDKTEVELESRTNLDVDKWGQYFFSLVDTELAWGIELEEGGDNSWIMGLLSDAASDNKEGKAIARLYDYADRLTNNNFRRRAAELNVTSPLVMSGARYLTGTWINAQGEERDLRDWDLLAWLAQNPNDEGESALRYQDVIDRTDLDVEIRVSEQYAQLTRALGVSNVKFARYVDLAFIDPKFIEALALAVGDCKINIDQRNASYSFGQRRLRGNTVIRNYRGGDLTGGQQGLAGGRRNGGGNGDRSLRGPVGNGFGHGSF